MKSQYKLSTSPRPPPDLPQTFPTHCLALKTIDGAGSKRCCPHTSLYLSLADKLAQSGPSFDISSTSHSSTGRSGIGLSRVINLTHTYGQFRVPDSLQMLGCGLWEDMQTQGEHANSPQIGLWGPGMEPVSIFRCRDAKVQGRQIDLSEDAARNRAIFCITTPSCPHAVLPI